MHLIALPTESLHYRCNFKRHKRAVGPTKIKKVSKTSYFSEYLGHTYNIECLNVIQVDFEQYDGVIAAVNVNNVHWTFVVSRK